MVAVVWARRPTEVVRVLRFEGRYDSLEERRRAFARVTKSGVGAGGRTTEGEEETLEEAAAQAAADDVARIVGTRENMVK